MTLTQARVFFRSRSCFCLVLLFAQQSDSEIKCCIWSSEHVPLPTYVQLRLQKV